MSLDERRIAMLREMGIAVWPTRGAASVSAPPASLQKPSTGPITALESRPAPVLAPAPEPLALAPAPQSAPVPVTPEPRVAPVARQAPAPTVAQTTTPTPARSPAELARIAQLDWPALRAEVQACQACSLCATRQNTVFGVGSVQAHWMVVGEAPGEQEDLRGEPFVGAAGQLLDRMLAALKLTRQETSAGQDLSPAGQVYVANTLKCRPPGNRNPAPEELSACEPYLQRQIALVQPKIILAMGRFAVHRLLRSEEPIGRLRGRVHQYQGVPVVVTYHPAYLLRNPLEKAKAWADLCLAADVVEGLLTQVSPAELSLSSPSVVASSH